MSVVPLKTFDEDIRSAFDRMKIVDPVDGLEFLPPKFIAPTLHDLGLNPTNTEVQEILGITDTKQEGRITFDTFCSFARQMSDTHLDDNLLNKCFSIFDTNNDNVLSRDEFRVALQHNGEGLTDEELDLAMKIADADGNGVINYSEFVAYMTQNDHLNAELRERVMNFRAQQSANFSNSPNGLTGSPSLRHASMRGSSITRDGSIRQTASPKRVESGLHSVSQRTAEQGSVTKSKLEELTKVSDSKDGQISVTATKDNAVTKAGDSTASNAKAGDSTASNAKAGDSTASNAKAGDSTASNAKAGDSNGSNNAVSNTGDKTSSKSTSKQKPIGDANARKCCTIS